jgi:hypothetical protein
MRYALRIDDILLVDSFIFSEWGPPVERMGRADETNGAKPWIG